MDASTALVVLRCCGSDAAPFAGALARAMRASRPDRHVLVEAVDGDVMWAPPPAAPVVAVRLVLVCGQAIEPSRLQPPDTTRPVHLAAVVVAPDGRDPAAPVQAVALPRVFADVAGLDGTAAMLHGVLDGEEREEARDTDEWLAPAETDVSGFEFGAPDFGDTGTAPAWPSSPEGASGLEEFRGAVPAPPPPPAPAARPAQETLILRAPPLPSEPAPVPPAGPPAPPSGAAPPPLSAAPPRPPGPRPSDPPPAVEAGPGRSPAAKVADGLKRIAGKVEHLAVAVVNDWILRAPPETPAPPAEPVLSRPPEAPLSTDAPSPVALGVSAPRTAAPGGEFTARFIAHVPGRQGAIAARLADLSPDTRSHLAVRQCQWAPGTAVTVALRARGLQIEPATRTFAWNGEEHIEEFDVTVPADALPGTVVLKFDAAIEGVIVATLRVDLVVTAEAPALRARTSATAMAARTAFASYAAADRARVLDRIAAVRISAGLDVFVDCLSLNPGEAWRERLLEEIQQRDVFLLFWSASASSSSEVAWEWRAAVQSRGAAAVQLHPLEPDVRPPAELADQHAGDPAMWVRRATAPPANA